MSQSRFSIVLVGVSALLRRPLVSRLRPADGERSPWVVFTARVGRFDSGFRLPLRRFPSAGWPSDSRLPFFGTHRFGVATRRVGLRVHRFRFSARTASEIAAGRVGLRAHCFRFSARAVSEIAARRVGLRAHCFRFSACTASEIALGGLVLPFGGLGFGLTASAFRRAPFRSGRWASSFFRLPLRKLPSAGWASGSLLPLFGMHRFGVAAGRVRSSAFRFGDCRSVVGASAFRFGVLPSASEIAARRVGLRAHCFRFSACTASEWLLGEFVLLPSALEIALGGLILPPSVSELPLGGWPSGSLLPLFGMHRFGVTAERVRSSAFRFGDCRSAGWPSGSLLPLFGTRRSAPLHRRSEDRRSTPTRQLFHFKTLIPTC